MLSTPQAAAVLTNLGFRVNTSGRFTQGLRDFQSGWNLGPALKIDGLRGPLTNAALLKSEARRRAGLGTASAHFSYREFTCKCGGRFPACRRILVVRTQLQRLEMYRSHAGSMVPVSGFRCVEYNKSMRGASNSQHTFGTGTDVKAQFPLAVVRGWKVFAGIGYGGKTGRVLHVDSRDVSGHNNGGSPTHPMIWVYPEW